MQTPSSYDVTVKAYDFEGVEPAAAGTCTTRYNFQQLTTPLSFGPSGNSITSTGGDLNVSTRFGQVTVTGADKNISVQVVLAGTATSAGSTTNLKIYDDPEGGNTGSFDVLPTFAPAPINFGPAPVTQVSTAFITRSAGTYSFELSTIATDPTSGSFTATASVISI